MTFHYPANSLQFNMLLGMSELQQQEQVLAARQEGLNLRHNSYDLLNEQGKM